MQTHYSSLVLTDAPVRALEINRTYARVAKGERVTQTHVRKPTLATKV